MGMTFTGGFTLTGGSRTIGSNNGSVSFNGTSQYLTVPANSVFAFGTGDFTVECWVYINTLSDGDAFVGSWTGTAATSAWLFTQGNSGSGGSPSNLRFGISSGSVTTFYEGTGGLSINNWIHIAAVRSGTTLTLYSNGISVYTNASISTNISVSSQALQINGVAGATFLTTGYISNLRIVKGVAVYTSNFALPVGNLLAVQNANENGYPSRTITGAQTSLLLNTFLNSNNFLADSSPYTFTVTNVGGATSSTLTPTYSSLTNGSVSFNGTTHYLAVPSNAVFSFSTGDFTIEHWMYSTSFAVQSATISLFSNNSGSYITGQCEIRVNTSGTISFVYATGVSAIATITTSASITTNSWYHIAVVRSGSGTGNLNIYINGVVLATSGGAVTQAIGTTGTGRIALNANSVGNLVFTGYLSNMRIVSGVAVYTGNFTPPVNVLTVIQSANINGNPSSAITGTQTSLLLATYYGNGFIGDGSTNAIVVTNPASAPSSTLAPTLTGTPVNGSLFINGSYINTTTTSSGFTLGTGDFTIEYWIYLTNVTGTKRFFGNVTTSSDTGFSMDIDTNQIGMGGWTTFTYFTPSPSLSAVFLNQWVHVAWVRISGVETLYVNGTILGTVTRSLNFSGNGALYLGVAGSFNTNFPMTGYISNFRIIKGVGVYSGGFNVPSSPLGIAQPNNQNGFPSLAISDTQTSILLNTYSGSPRDTSTYALTFTTSASVTSTTQSPTFSSYTLTNGSVSFNGSNQYLTVPASTAFNYGTGDFTWECWIYPQSTNRSIIDFWVSVSPLTVGQCQLIIENSTALLSFYYATGASSLTNITSASAVTLSAWSHVAVVRSGSGTGNLKMYINGTLAATSAGAVTQTLGVSSIAGSIGRQTVTNTFFYNGYVSNIRIVKGVGIYTSNFNLPSTPLAFSQDINQNGFPSAAVSSTQTSLLLNTYTGNSFASDISTNGFNITNVGAATSSSQAPTFVSSLTNGSASFNGTSQYLTVPNNTAFDFGTSDFTIEFWAYFNALTTDRLLVDRWASGNANSWQIYWRASSSSIVFYVGSTFVLVDPSTTNIVTNSWTHIAVTRSGTTNRLFINGIIVSTATNSTSLSNSLPLAVGLQFSTTNLYFAGYISNLRIVKGVAVYTTNFILPSSPLSVTQDAGVNGFPSAAITGVQTSLLLNTYYGGYNLTDDGSTNNFTVTNTGGTLTSTLAPTFTSPTFTNGSVSLNGTSQYLSVPDQVGLNMGADNFTIEAWIYLLATPGASGYGIIYKRATSAVFGGVGLGFTGAVLTPNLLATVNGTTWGVNITSSIAVAVGVWAHVAATRSGNIFTLWVNGVSGATVTLAGTIPTNAAALTVGAGAANGSFPFNGYISNVRIVKGVAVYTTNFTVPLDLLTVTQNINENGYSSKAITGSQTSLLLNTFYGSYFIADSSTNNFVLTNNGTSTSSILAPSFALNYTNGSLSFNGTTQFINYTSNSVYSICPTNTTDFTIEFWINPTVTGAGKQVAQVQQGPSPGRAWSITHNGDNSLGFNWTQNGTVWNPTTNGDNNNSNGNVVVGVWSHVAFVKIGTIWTWYVNGVASGTGTFGKSTWVGGPIAFPSGSQLALGAAYYPSGTATEAYWNGKISNFRMVKGIGLYTSNFAVPTGPLTVTQTVNQNGFPSQAISSSETVILLNTYTGTGFTGEGANQIVPINTGAATSSSVTPFS